MQVSEGLIFVSWFPAMGKLQFWRRSMLFAIPQISWAQKFKDDTLELHPTQ